MTGAALLVVLLLLLGRRSSRGGGGGGGGATGNVDVEGVTVRDLDPHDTDPNCRWSRDNIPEEGVSLYNPRNLDDPHALLFAWDLAPGECLTYRQGYDRASQRRRSEING